MPVTTAIAHRGSAAAHSGEPGAAMRAVAARLAAHGFDVRGPAWAEGRRLMVTNLAGATCDVTAEDDGPVTWEYARGSRDRKSTRLNSSHVAISYAVFCLKKKKK